MIGGVKLAVLASFLLASQAFSGSIPIQGKAQELRNRLVTTKKVDLILNCVDTSFCNSCKCVDALKELGALAFSLVTVTVGNQSRSPVTSPVTLVVKYRDFKTQEEKRITKYLGDFRPNKYRKITVIGNKRNAVIKGPILVDANYGLVIEVLPTHTTYLPNGKPIELGRLKTKYVDTNPENNKQVIKKCTPCIE
jgi:hypothetical protein